MRYKAISLAIAVLLIATPVYAQLKSYIVVETPLTAEPTTVITGQPFTQVYVVRFIDLTDSGEEIIVQEEFLDNLKTLGEFEILDFYIDKETKRGEFLEHIWYLRFVLSVVNPKKGDYIIPPLEIPWKHKKAGQEANDPSILTNYNFKTNEVHINYVTTIPEKAPYLAIRDGMNFGNFKNQTRVWWAIAWFLRVAPLMLLLIVFVAWKRFSRRNEYKVEDAETEDKVGVGEKIKTRSELMAWFNLRISIRRLKNSQTGSHVQTINYLKAETAVVSAVKDYLRAQIPQLSVGSTPLAMAEYISEKAGHYSTKKDALFQLARKAAAYQADIEKGADDCFRNPLMEVKELRSILSQSRPHRRAVLFLQNSFLEARSRLQKTWLMRILCKIGRRQ